MHKCCQGRSGPHTLHVVGRVQANPATLQLALAPALFILLTHLQQLLPCEKGDWSLAVARPTPATGSRTKGEVVVSEPS